MESDFKTSDLVNKAQTVAKLVVRKLNDLKQVN